VFQVRSANAEDAKAIFRIWADGWNYAYKNILSPYLFARRPSDTVVEDKDNRCSDRLAAKTAGGDIYLVATDSDKVVGFVSGGAIHSDECKADTELRRMYVNPDYIGRGVGKLLFQEFAQNMKSQGHKTLGLMCFSDNAGMGFYKKMGGVVTVERPCSEKLECVMDSFIEFNIDDVLSK
jgi:GNAT superfamily N-acetyltransferase